MKIKILPRAKKRLKKLNKVDQIAVGEKVRKLASNEDGQKKLRGYRAIFRVRVGDIRIIFKKNRKEIYIILIGHRKDIYQALKRLVN